MAATFAGPSYFNNSKDIFKYRDNEMCSKWRKDDSYFGQFSISTFQNNKGDIVLYGNVKPEFFESFSKYKINLKYWAANSPDSHCSFSGSGLPFPNETIAYENTKNQGSLPIVDLNFSLNMLKPNSYYTNQGKVLVKPHVNIMFMTGDNKPLGTIYKIDIDNYIPYRTLSMERKNVMFYHNALLPIRTQEEIIRDSAYPEQTMKEHKNFWGLKPSN
tara:strand:+ start:127 stop:774 length:648 start_codon:yes stop_codon:yes gene_type:complete